MPEHPPRGDWHPYRLPVYWSYYRLRRRLKQPGAARRVMCWTVLPTAAIVLIFVVLGPLSDLIARHDLGALALAQRAAHLQAARETARTQLLTLGAGLFPAGALWFTARNFSLSREGQVTERYTKAIEQLGSDKIDVRIGGIYALERVARDSAKDHPTVMEVLAAFIREHSREQWPLHTSGGEAPLRTTRPDVQAAVTVLGRRNSEHDRMNRIREPEPINLAGANLSRANVRRGDLSNVQLTNAVLSHADFTGSLLEETDLTGADLTGANLTGVLLYTTRIEGAVFPLDWTVPRGWKRDPDSG